MPDDKGSAQELIAEFSCDEAINRKRSLARNEKLCFPFVEPAQAESTAFVLPLEPLRGKNDLSGLQAVAVSVAASGQAAEALSSSAESMQKAA